MTHQELLKTLINTIEDTLTCFNNTTKLLTETSIKQGKPINIKLPNLETQIQQPDPYTTKTLKHLQETTTKAQNIIQDIERAYGSTRDVRLLKEMYTRVVETCVDTVNVVVEASLILGEPMSITLASTSYARERLLELGHAELADLIEHLVADLTWRIRRLHDIVRRLGKHGSK